MAETNSLLNCRTGNCTGGSNPPFSAKPTKDRISAVFFFLQIGEDGKFACQAYAEIPLSPRRYCLPAPLI